MEQIENLIDIIKQTYVLCHHDRFPTIDSFSRLIEIDESNL